MGAVAHVTSDRRSKRTLAPPTPLGQLLSPGDFQAALRREERITHRSCRPAACRSGADAERSVVALKTQTASPGPPYGDQQESL